MATVTTKQVWAEIGRRSFAVVSFLSLDGEPRSAGVVYTVAGHRLLFASGRVSWKVRGLRADPHIAITVTVVRRIPFMPWIPIPAATIGFHGTASISAVDDVDAAACRRLLGPRWDDPVVRDATCIVTVSPEGRFATHGIGVSLREMRDSVRARGHAPVGKTPAG